jgi:hypothetical protein
MALKILLFPNSRNKLALITIFLAVLGGASWWQYDLNQQAKKVKLKAEQVRTIKVMHEAGVEARKIWLNQGKPVLQEDDIPASDQEELAQAKFWNNLSKEKRDAMRVDVVNSGAVPSNIK